jgi:hypothetical protein
MITKKSVIYTFFSINVCYIIAKGNDLSNKSVTQKDKMKISAK